MGTWSVHETALGTIYVHFLPNGKYTTNFCDLYSLPTHMIFENIEKIHSNKDDNDENVKVIHDFLNVLAMKWFFCEV